MTAASILTAGSRTWRCFRWAESGASIVEFALFAPLLLFAVLATIDLGRALTERISMGHVIRSGAQAAMQDPGSDDVRMMLQTTASRNFVVDDGNSDDTFTMGDPMSISVDRFCACPGAADTAVSCSTICPGPEPTFIYYRLAAEKDFSGILVPDIPLNSSAQVQVR